MSKTIIIVGYGPGVASAVAEKFGSVGYSVALVARNAERLAEGVATLKEKGIVAAAFQADAGNVAAVRAAVQGAQAAFGPITILHWNAVAGTDVENFLTADPAMTVNMFNSAVAGMLGAVQEALPDLQGSKESAILVTNGISGETNDFVDAFGAHRNVMGLALANATKSKLVGLLAQKLKEDGIYVGQVMIAGLVKGSRPGMPGGIETSAIADKFWEVYQARDEIRARIGDPPSA